MLPLTLAQVAAAVGGRLADTDGTPLVTGSVEFDSREITPGGLFVAIPGERADGHDFAATAVRAGAVGVLAAREVGVPAVIVPPTAAASSGVYALAGDANGTGAAVLAGLAALANHVARALITDGLTVIGVTGSAGKTSTKDLIAGLIAPLGPMVAPPGSFNNEVGHPWTVLRADAHTQNLLLELSARGPGHIAALCRVAPPQIGAVLNVGTAHLGEFGSREGIARAKGELVEALPSAADGGVAILNADDPLVAPMADRTDARVVLVGESPAALVRAVDVGIDEQARAAFTLLSPSGTARVELGMHGAHHVGNALVAAAIGLELGMTPDVVAAGLAAARPMSPHRMAVATRADGLTVVDDAYNANPTAVRAALNTVAAMATARGTRAKTWAVLGRMAELGDDETTAHEEIGRLVVRLGIDRLVVVGEAARAMHLGAVNEGYREESVLVPDVNTAIALLRERVRPGDMVLVKASKVVGLWRIADALLADGGNDTSAGGVA